MPLRVRRDEFRSPQEFRRYDTFKLLVDVFDFCFREKLQQIFDRRPHLGREFALRIKEIVRRELMNCREVVRRLLTRHVVIERRNELSLHLRRL